MKQFKIIIIILFSLITHSCSLLTKVPQSVPNYTLDSNTRNELIKGGKMSLPSDSSRNIIVYNVIEKEDKKNRISDETIRFFVAQFFTTLTTILTIIAVENTP